MDNDFNELLGGAEPAPARKPISALHQLLLDVCPPDEKGNVSVVVLAKKMDVTPQAIYNIISRNRITYRRAITILGLDPDTPYSVSDFSEWLR